MPSVTDPEIRAFLLEGTRTGKLSYRAANGRPLVAPVWFVIDDGRLVFNTGKDTAKSLLIKDFMPLPGLADPVACGRRPSAVWAAGRFGSGQAVWS